MKKNLLLFFVSIGLLFLVTPVLSHAGLVPCGQTPSDRCELADLFILIRNIYDFILIIANSVAALLIIFGGILMILSAGNSSVFENGKRMIWGSIIALLFMWTAWLVIHTTLWILGINPAFIS